MAKKNRKLKDLEQNTVTAQDQFLTTDQGVRINDNQNTLKAGSRGPSLLEDFIFREKIFNFDHERIPERIVHARGVGAHGVFRLTKSLQPYTSAAFLQDTSRETPVFVRFSTVAGSRGSTDLARDARGFAVKFYTEEGNFDLVGNNIPVFFIQDAMKFPDLIHSVKPEPNNEIPQAQSAHDTFWDFISLMPESMHMVLWVMSDRGIPRSLRMMEGFGIHTFRFVNDKGESTFVKFHWKPRLGVHSVAWNEALKISGFDPDFHRRDLFNAIEKGHFPEWDLGVQLLSEAAADKLDIDILDPTKLIPEEIAPVQIVGTMTLNKNPDNYFAETEQVAFHPGHLVPGIDFSDDPLLQGRLFSYTDTQLSRLGSPNFHQIPINRGINPVHNNQRDGHMQQNVHQGAAAYEPNTLGGGCPYQAAMAQGGFVSFPEKIDAHKQRGKSASFSDHFSQATLFYNSQSTPEKTHLTNALSFELGKVKHTEIRQRVVNLLQFVDKSLAQNVATNLKLKVEKAELPLNHGIGADADKKLHEPSNKKPIIEKSEALSMARIKNPSIETRVIAFLLADGFSDADITAMKKALEAQGAFTKIIAPRHGTVVSDKGKEYPVDEAFDSTASVLYDAVFVPGGDKSVASIQEDPDVIHFINELYRHCKALAFTDASAAILEHTYIKKEKEEAGIYIEKNVEKLSAAFITGMGQHRFWEREIQRLVPA